MSQIAWFKVDDQLAFNAKVMLAGNSAMGLWVRAGSWSSAQLTGGFIPEHMAKAMANAMANECDIDALVMAGLWKEVEGGYQFHDWDEFQPSAEAEKEKRKQTSIARSEAGKAGAAARWAKENDGKADGKRNGKTVATEWQTDAPVPTRPVPSSSETEKKKTATRLSKDWAPTASHIEKAREKNIDLLQQAEFFKLHAETHDRKAVNWNAAFTTWLTKAKPGPSQSASGQLNVDAILGRDLWQLPAPPDDLPRSEYKAWAVRVRREHDEARYAEAQKRATA